MRCEIVRHGEALSGLLQAWTAMWNATGVRPATLHPAWVISWWRCFGGAQGGAGAFDGELLAIVAWRGREMVGVAPLYVAPPHGGTLRARELRLIGDDLVGVGQAILAAPGEEGRVRDVVVEALAGETNWDLLDLTLATRPNESRLLSPSGGDADALALRFAAMGRAVERSEARGRLALDLPGPGAGRERFVDALRAPPGEAGGATESAAWDEPTPRGLETLSRLLSSAAPGPRPAAGALAAFLDGALPPLRSAGVAQIGLWPGADRTSAGAVVIVSDGERRMELLKAAGDRRAGDRLTLLAIRRALDDGAARYELSAAALPWSGAAHAEGADGASARALGASRAPGVRLRVFSRAAASMMERGYATIMRRAVSAADSAVARVRGPIDTIRGLRDSGPAVVTRAVGRVATFSRLHLYRGELFAWSPAPLPDFASIRVLGRQEFDALSTEARAHFIERLDLVEGYCRQKWERGDLVITAFHDGDPVGILWCARGPVFVPGIGREVKPAAAEAYVHDVYVAPSARGHAVAPAMLEFLARELRDRDVYRGWALIERSNTASTRAFEKASWASVADVIYARMGTTSRVLVRPPDPEARKFLGLVQ